MSLVYSPSQGRYVPRAAPLELYTFKVTDAVTGLPIFKAECSIVDRLPYEGVGGYTDLNGVCTLEVLFAAHYYTVYKAGYVTKTGSLPGTQINVALTPTAVQYWVVVNAGTGGTVDPSGNFQVAANTKITVTATPSTGYILDYWLVNGAKSGNTNPLGVVIDKDNFSVYAVFKVVETPPPPPPTDTWPVTRQVHVFDNVKFETGWGTWVEKSKPLNGVDMGALVGGKISYTVNYVSAVLTGIHVYFYVNDVQVGEVFPTKGQPVSGEIDITGYLYGTNELKVGISAGPAGFNVVYVDEWITLGYSQEPVVEPSLPPEWLEWIKQNWKWLAIGGGALTGLYLLTRKGAPVFAPQIVIRREGE